ncbi:MAG: hypothetical protein JW863_03060 [Chitinispirillaceae bacterium]|nr:hypothetical protein [Chitinispirillaceae bacterium]
MNESSWERTRRNEQKRLLIVLLVVCPLCAVGILLYLNNRDQIGVSVTASGPERFAPDTADRISTTGDTAETALPDTDQRKAALTEKPQASSKKPKMTPMRTDIPEEGSPMVSEETATRPPPASAVSAVSEKDSCCSILLPTIACISENPKDVVINLSLELFFSDIEKRSAILLRRDDVKVMVLRTMRDQQLPAMKIDELETLLQRGIAPVLPNSGITRIKIRNIQIEKATR